MMTAKRSTKRARSPSELADLARDLAQGWMEGEPIMTWLIRHEGKAGELSALVEDGWSWADVGLAMAMAGISYRPGTPINPQTLRQRAYDARVSVRARIEKRNAAHRLDMGQARLTTFPRTPAPPVETPAQSAPTRSTEVQEFRPVSWRNPPPPQTDPKPTYPLVPRPEAVDAETAIARMFGRPPPKKGG